MFRGVVKGECIADVLTVCARAFVLRLSITYPPLLSGF